MSSLSVNEAPCKCRMRVEQKAREATYTTTHALEQQVCSVQSGQARDEAQDYHLHCSHSHSITNAYGCV